MNMLKLHKFIAYACLACIPIAFIVGGLSDSTLQTKKGINVLFLLGGIYLPFYCLRCAHTGEMTTYIGHKLYKEKEPILFWPLVGAYFLLAILLLLAPFIKHA